MKHFLYSLVLLLLFVSCGNNNSINTKNVNLAMLATDLEILAADDMEGRAPCTAGGERASAICNRVWRKLSWSRPWRSYLQEVPLVKILPIHPSRWLSRIKGVMIYEWYRNKPLESDVEP